MNSWVFLKKELREIMRTYKIWVAPAIFLFFGLMSPPAAKFLPDLVKSQLEAQKILIKIPKATATDSFIQFYKNLSQLGILAIILLSMGLVSEEKARGTFSILLTKPLSRFLIILTKFFAQFLLIGSSILLGAVACYYYTLLLFDKADLKPFIQSTTLFLIYTLLILAITLFFSILSRSQIVSGGLSLLAVFTLSLLPLIGKFFEKRSPAALLSIANSLASGKGQFADANWPILTAVLAAIFFLGLGIFIFNRQEF